MPLTNAEWQKRQGKARSMSQYIKMEGRRVNDAKGREM